jgi:isochorismate synthase
MTGSKLVGTINSIINSSLPFAFYFYPGETEPEIVIQLTGEIQKYKSVTDLMDAQGLVIAPFIISGDTPLILLRPDIHLKGRSVIADLKVPAQEKAPVILPKENKIADIGKHDYLILANKTIAKIQAGEFEKAVISRTITTEIPKNLSIAELVIALKAKADNAFVYLINTPATGIWLGASPETLLSKKDERYQTVSLAGTMPLNKANNYNWSANLKQEQEIVSEFIENQLKIFKITEFNRNGPFTQPAANVAHLKTTFEFPIEKLNGEVSAFVGTLQLSPAVCGSPKEKAKEFIVQNELHKREYYTGFLGAWNLVDKLELFVNIRCLKVMGNQAVLYVGGGITANSEPEKEWEETNHKAKALLSIMK